MPKRHRQPEPVNSHKMGRVEQGGKKTTPHKAATTTAAPPPRATRSVASTADSIASSTSGVFPTTPSALTEKQRRQKARADTTRTAAAGDGEAVTAHSTTSSAIDSPLTSEAMSYDSSQVGDDGNQDYYGSHSDEDVRVSESEQDEMRAMRRAVRANRVAAASRRKGRAQELGMTETTSSTDSEATDTDLSEEERRGIADEDPFDINAPIQQLTTSSEGEDDSDSGDEDDEEDDISEDMSLDEEQGIYESHEEHDDDDDEDDDDSDDEEGGDDDDDDDDSDDSDREQVTVDFGVYDMEPKHVDAVMHLMDQLCPDKMNEVDRDDLGAALAENPYTCVVKVGDNDDDDDDDNTTKNEEEEEEEFYGLASMLDVAHGVKRHPAAFRALQTLLKEQVWRTAHPGLPPTEILTTVTEDKAQLAKCGLLVTEYIRNVPVELSVQILEDIVRRLQDAPSTASAATGEPGKDSASVRFMKPCMYAVLAKVQRSMDAPVTLVKKSQKKGSAAPAKSAEASKEEKLNLDEYIFWRQEDHVLFRFRDTRIATYAYRCRSQYDGQPEQEIPISLFFVLQHGAILQAIDELKKQDLTKTEVTRFH